MCEAHKIEVQTKSGICQPVVDNIARHCNQRVTFCKSGCRLCITSLQQVCSTSNVCRHSVSRQHATDR